jgi:hypothetical protein
MQERSMEVTALAFFSVMVALYSQMAAIALILGGSIFAAAGSMHGAAALITGAVFLGVAVAAYAIGYAFWTRRHWSWAGGMVVFASLIVVNLVLSLISGNPLSAILPVVGSAIAIWQLQRPAIRAELLGTELVEGSSPATEALETAEALR